MPHTKTRMICTVLTVLTTTAVCALAQHGGHGSHLPMTDQPLVLQCTVRVGDHTETVETSLRVPPAATADDLNQTVQLPKPFPTVRLTTYLPRARMEQNAVEETATQRPPAVQIAIEGPTQSLKRWLVADDLERNRLTSFIATWRYAAVKDGKERDQLFRDFREELSRPPRVVISQPGKGTAHSLAVDSTDWTDFKDLGCRARVVRFYSDFAMDDATGKPVNQSDKRVNPAALVEIETAGRRSEQWVFSKFPDYRKEVVGTPYHVRLDCPVEQESATPAFVVVTIGRSKHEAWSRYQGKVTSRPIDGGDSVSISGSQYTFRIASFIRSARLDENYAVADRGSAVPALKIETTDASGDVVTRWLESGKTRVVATAQGPLTLTFGPRSTTPVVEAHSPGAKR